MNYKILALLAPLVVSSTASISTPSSFDTGIQKPSFFSSLPLILTSFGNIYEQDSFSCSTLGPFSLSTVTNNVSVTFNYQYYSISSQKIVERVRLFNSSNSVVSSISNAYINYTRGTANTVTFNLRIRDYLTRNGLTLKFEIIKESDYSVLKEYSATFYPSSDAQVSWVDLKQSPHVSQSLGFYSKNSQIHPLVETIDFTNFGDYLDVDNYYRLDINKNRIGYPNSYSFKYNNAYLTFNDNDYLFPYLSHQETGDIIIPLKMTKTLGYIYPNIKNTYYINKRTLQISDTYRSGFVTTKQFYLPVNGRSKFNGKQLYLVLEGFGLDNISTTIPIKYETSKSIVGVCKDGDSCIIGGKR